MGATLNNISQIHKARGDYDLALEYLEKSLSIRQEIGYIDGLATTLNNMGAIFLNQKNGIEKATLAFWQSYQINQKLGSPNVKHPAAYLAKIIERIGQERFKDIIARLGGLGYVHCKSRLLKV